MPFILEHSGIVIGIIAAVIVLIILASGYVKAPPDKAYIISGIGKKQGSLSVRLQLRYLSLNVLISLI